MGRETERRCSVNDGQRHGGRKGKGRVKGGGCHMESKREIDKLASFQKTETQEAVARIM